MANSENSIKNLKINMKKLDNLAYHPPSTYVTDLLNLCKYVLIQYKKIGEVKLKFRNIIFYRDVSTFK